MVPMPKPRYVRVLDSNTGVKERGKSQGGVAMARTSKKVSAIAAKLWDKAGQWGITDEELDALATPEGACHFDPLFKSIINARRHILPKPRIDRIVEAVQLLGGGDEDMRRVLTEKDLAEKIAAVIMVDKAVAATVGNVLATVVNYAIGLTKMIQTAVGPDNLRNINSSITPERFKMTGEGVRNARFEVQRFRDGETGKECAKRLVLEGFVLENTAELAAFLEQHPEEVEKYSWVLALGEASRWAGSGGGVRVPSARVSGASRSFRLDWFRDQFATDGGVLVSSK